ncbi:RDD family protein [Nocardia mangyaensis]|uniref:RDD family protein n=1 Tax=Nocardia mangyaensis TaxID=2213200 RepID=UPI002677318D|nr:RDD family protein [Nocardia mangyaensis]MDO3645778.1 RDD family protein [Nocardia mangyaensis]
MNDSRGRQREAAALANRYDRRPDGTLRLGPALDKDGVPLPPASSLTITRPDGTEGTAVPVTLAVLIDMALHLGIGITTWWLLHPDAPAMAILYGLLAWIGSSFLHRTLLQRLTRTTLGKAVFALRLRHPDGTYPSLSRLIRRWTSSLLETTVTLLTSP